MDVNSVLDDIAKNVNETLDLMMPCLVFVRARQTDEALEDQAQTAKYKRMAEEQAAARRVQEEQLGIAGLSDAEKAAYFRNMAQQQQSGIAGAGERVKAGPNLRLVKKAAGGPVDLHLVLATYLSYIRKGKDDNWKFQDQSQENSRQA